MKVIAGVTLILLLAFLGSRWTFTRVRLPLAARHIYLTGTEYILIGLCLGAALLDLLDAPTLRGLSPVLNLALGWVGLLFGIQLELRQIKRFPAQHLQVALTQGLVTGLVCAGGFLLLPNWIPPLPAAPPLPGTLQASTTTAALILAALAVPTAQSSLALIEQELGARQSPVMQILRYVAGMDALLGLLALGVLFALSHEASPLGLPPRLVPLQILGLAVGLGLLTGLVLHVLTRLQCPQEELLLYTVGLVVFCAGAAAFLKLSPLFVTMVAGLLIANLRGQKERIGRVLVSLEKPLYLVLLLMAGARVMPAFWIGQGLALGLAYAALRALGKLCGGLLASRLFRAPERLSPWLGLGLVSQGGMAVAMVVSFHQAFFGPAADAILVMVLLAVIVNELCSPALARRVLPANADGGAGGGAGNADAGHADGQNSEAK